MTEALNLEPTTEIQVGRAQRLHQTKNRRQLALAIGTILFMGKKRLPTPPIKEAGTLILTSGAPCME